MKPAQNPGRFTAVAGWRELDGTHRSLMAQDLVTPSPDTHNRIRHDRVDKTGSVTLRINGRLHHIGIGRTHVILIVQDHSIQVVNATAGELLRHLVLDPTRDYQPQHKQGKARTKNAGSDLSYVLRQDNRRADRI